jgi:putative transcriptional regulator
LSAVTESLTGKLLVASPALQDGNFAWSVVYLCAHSDQGAFGLIINRPIEGAPVGEHLPHWMEHVNRPAVLFQGGPVEASAAFGLSRLQGVAPPEGWLAVTEGIGLIDLSLDAGAIAGSLDGLRLFSGYSGWGPGQLEGEIEQEAWFVVEAAPADLFSDEPESLWRQVLRRQPGKLALFAYFPRDPSAN